MSKNITPTIEEVLELFPEFVDDILDPNLKASNFEKEVIGQDELNGQIYETKSSTHPFLDKLNEYIIARSDLYDPEARDPETNKKLAVNEFLGKVMLEDIKETPENIAAPIIAAYIKKSHSGDNDQFFYNLMHDKGFNLKYGARGVPNKNSFSLNIFDIAYAPIFDGYLAQEKDIIQETCQTAKEDLISSLLENENIERLLLQYERTGRILIEVAKFDIKNLPTVVEFFEYLVETTESLDREKGRYLNFVSEEEFEKMSQTYEEFKLLHNVVIAKTPSDKAKAYSDIVSSVRESSSNIFIRCVNAILKLLGFSPEKTIKQRAAERLKNTEQRVRDSYSSETTSSDSYTQDESSYEDEEKNNSFGFSYEDPEIKTVTPNPEKEEEIIITKGMSL